MYRAQIVLIMRTVTVCVVVFIHRVQILGKHLVEQGMRPLYLFDKELSGHLVLGLFVHHLPCNSRLQLRFTNLDVG